MVLGEQGEERKGELDSYIVLDAQKNYSPSPEERKHSIANRLAKSDYSSSMLARRLN